jgi:non-specific serine/threonine protein kinase/protein-serine/threonine kinase
MVSERTSGRMAQRAPETLRGVRGRLWRDPVPPRALRPETPQWLQKTLPKAPAADPLRRSQGARPMVFDLSPPPAGGADRPHAPGAPGRLASGP